MERKDTPEGLIQHVVICNCNEKIKYIVEELHEGSYQEPIDVVLIVQDAVLWDHHPEWHPKAGNRAHFFVIEGCPTDENVLKRAQISFARAAVILADPNQRELSDARSTLVAMAIERQNPQVHTIIELISSINRSHLRTTKIDEVICEGEISEKIIAQSCITPGIKNIFERLLTAAVETNQIFLSQVPSPLSGETFRSLARRAIEREVPYILCGFVLHRKKSESILPSNSLFTHEKERMDGIRRITVLNPRAYVEPGKDTLLTDQDRLIAMAHNPPDLNLLV